MSFIRPELQARLWRWRESLLGGLLSVIGMYWSVSTSGLMSAVGTSLAIVGALAVFAGIQRSRFRVGQDGPGVVQVVEGQVTYYGPLDGGSISIDGLQRVELEPSGEKAASWVLVEPGKPPLHIPINAANAEALFDVFAALEGIRTENMLARLRDRPDRRVTIWTQPQRRLH